MAFGDLATLADVKAWLQLGVDDFPPHDDALLSRLITSASGFIQRWLSRPLFSQDWIETRDGPGIWPYTGETRFQFAAFPVTAVSLVVVNGTTIPAVPPIVPAPPGQTAPTFSSTQWGYLFSPTQLVIHGYFVPRLAQCVTIQYTAGYSTIPVDISQACIELVVLRYRERKRIGEISQSIGGMQTASYSQKDMHDSTKTLLQQYRLVTPISGFLQSASTQTDAAILAAIA